MVITAEPIAPPETALPRMAVRPTALGIVINFDKPSEPKATTDLNMPLSTDVRVQSIRSTPYSSGLQGTASWEQKAQEAQRDTGKREFDVRKGKKEPIYIKANHYDDPFHPDPNRVMITPGWDDEGKTISIGTTGGASKVLGLRTRDGGLNIYRRVMSENVATITKLTAEQLALFQTLPEPEREVVQDLLATPIPASEPTPKDTMPTPIVATEPSQVSEPADISRALETAAKTGLISEIAISPAETNRLAEIGKRITRLTDWTTRKMNRAIIEVAETYDAFKKLPLPVKYIIRFGTVTLIPFLLTSDVATNFSSIAHANPPPDMPHIPVPGHTDVSIGTPELPVQPSVPDMPHVTTVDTTPHVETPPVHVDNVCQMATDGPKASDSWPHPEGWKPAADFQNDVFQPAADFQNAIFDKVITCGQEAFNPDGSLIWDKVKGVITEAEYNTFNNNLENVVRTTNLTGNPLDDSYVPKGSTPREPPGSAKD